MRTVLLVGIALCSSGCVASLEPRAAFDSGPGEAAMERQVVVTVRNAPANAARFAGSTVKGYDAAAGYQASPAALRDTAQLASQYRLRPVAAWPIELLKVHCIVFEAAGDESIDVLLERLRRDARVESAQPLHSFGTRSSRYDDTYLTLQNNLSTLQIEQAHQWSRGRGVRVAVVDSGIDTAHPDLAGRIAVDLDLTGLPKTSRVRDRHGIAVAGVIAATAGNGQGIVGIAPDAKLLALRACWQVGDPDGEDGGSRCNTFTLARALAAAIEHRADIVNLSLTGPHDPLLERLLRRAMGMGKIVVSALPEEGEPGSADFPASLPGVLAVRSAETPHGDSSGPTGALLAPGRRILTLRPQAGYDFENGSSFAAAHVSGVTALLLALRGGLTAERIHGLLSGAAALATASGSSRNAVVNACVALAGLLHVDCSPDLERHASSPEGMAGEAGDWRPDD